MCIRDSPSFDLLKQRESKLHLCRLFVALFFIVELLEHLDLFFDGGFEAIMLGALLVTRSQSLVRVPLEGALSDPASIPELPRVRWQVAFGVPSLIAFALVLLVEHFNYLHHFSVRFVVRTGWLEATRLVEGTHIGEVVIVSTIAGLDQLVSRH